MLRVFVLCLVATLALGRSSYHGKRGHPSKKGGAGGPGPNPEDIFFQLKESFEGSVNNDMLLEKFGGIIATVEAELTDDIVCDATLMADFMRQFEDDAAAAQADAEKAEGKVNKNAVNAAGPLCPDVAEQIMSYRILEKDECLSGAGLCENCKEALLLEGKCFYNAIEEAIAWLNEKAIAPEPITKEVVRKAIGKMNKFAKAGKQFERAFEKYGESAAVPLASEATPTKRLIALLQRAIDKLN